MKASTLLTLVVIFAAIAVYFTPPPAGVSVEMMHAAALVVFTVGLWAAGSLPEHIVGLLFFMLAMVLAVAPAQVVFSGFASATLWLVLGGLIMAEAVNRTGLAQRLASVLFDRVALSYAQLVVAVVMASIVLSFLIPATVSRVLLLLPIVMALAKRVGFEHDSTGYNGLCLATIVATYQCGTAVLPANAPNLVLAGSAEALYGVQITYAEYLWVQFPVLGALKSLAIIAFVLWLFPAQARSAPGVRAIEPLTPEQRRMVVILAVSLVLWATDFLHGIKSGWIALAAGIACLLPWVGVMPVTAFYSVRLGPYFYVGATLGTRAGDTDDRTERRSRQAAARRAATHARRRFRQFRHVVGAGDIRGAVHHQPGAAGGAGAAGRVFRAGHRLAAESRADGDRGGFHDVSAAVPGAARDGGAAGGCAADEAMLRLALPLAAFSLLVILPLQYLWWRVIGYFG